MKQHVDFARGEKIVGRAFVGRGVVSLRLGLAEDQMRFVETAEPVDARQQIVGDAMHDLTDIAVHIGMQPAEIGDAGGGAHAAEKAVALDQQRFAPERAGRRSRGDAGGAAAEHDDLVSAEDRRLTRRLGDGRQDGAPGDVPFRPPEPL